MATTVLGAGEIYDANVSAQAAIATTKMAQRTNAKYPVPLTAFRVWDALQTNLTTPASDDLGIVTGTFGSGASHVSSGDLKTAGLTTRRMRALLVVPPNFEGNSQTVSLSIFGGMVTSVADGSATVDVEAWRVDRDGTIGAADLCLTAAQSINSLTAAEKSFDLTNADIVAGDTLDVRVSVAVSDTATVTAVIAAVWDVVLLADTRG